MNELKPCPCCGSTAVQRENKKGTLICIECENPVCGLRTGWFLTYAEALAAWNKREGLNNLKRITYIYPWVHAREEVTHYEGCEAVHPACKIARLERENVDLRKSIKLLIDEIAFYENKFKSVASALKGEK